MSLVRCTSSGRCSRASLAWRTSSWDASSTGPPRGQAASGCFRRCARSPRASPSLGPPSTKPTTGGTTTAPHSCDLPYTGAREWTRTRWPRYWRPSRTQTLSRLATPVPPAWAQVLHHKALMVVGWDGKAKESAGRWVGVTRDGTLFCLLRGNRPLAMPPDPRDVAWVVLASIPQVYVVWYVVLPAPGSPQLLPQHQYPRADAETTARAWLAARELVRA